MLSSLLICCRCLMLRAHRCILECGGTGDTSPGPRAHGLANGALRAGTSKPHVLFSAMMSVGGEAGRARDDRRRVASSCTPLQSVAKQAAPHCQHARPPSHCQHHHQQQLTWGHALAVKAHLDLLMSPFPLPFSLQPPPLLVACSQASLWRQQPGRTLNEPMSHLPGISQQSSSKQSSGPSELADTLRMYGESHIFSQKRGST